MRIYIHHIKTFSKQMLFVALAGLLSWNSVAGFGGGTDPELRTTSKLSSYQKNQYKKDATRLALRQIADGKSYDQLNPEVPQDMVESIYKSLVAVHQSDLTEAKLVTKRHKLHTYPIPTVDRMVVIYKRDAPWAVPLRLGDDVTDNEKINQLSEKFKLKIDQHVEWDEEHNSFNMRAEESLNIASVAKTLSTVENITLVDMMEPNGDGNDIEVKKLNNGWEINYIIKFDGCITGCKKRHTWTFEVTNSGNVSFKGESGDELPKWMK